MQTNDRAKQKEEENRNEYIPGTQEKSSLGGNFNSGVTSEDPVEKDEIEKKGSLANIKSQGENQKKEDGDR